MNKKKKVEIDADELRMLLASARKIGEFKANIENLKIAVGVVSEDSLRNYYDGIDEISYFLRGRCKEEEDG